jgi:uncharacterized protein YebE (UPF0316 family)
VKAQEFGPIVMPTINNILILTFFGINLKPQILLGWGIPWGQIRPEFIPLAIFLLRSLNNTLSTLRMLLVVRGKAFYAWIIGFLEALSFILGITGVISDLLNPFNLIAYTAGYATGNTIGMTIESLVAPGHSFLRIISPRRGNIITDKLRELGRGVTEISAMGLDGMVSVLFCYVPRREVKETKNQILAIDPDVFITVESVREIRGGWRA